jgi:hypothetical protein
MTFIKGICLGISDSRCTVLKTVRVPSPIYNNFLQCFGSGSGLDPDSIRSVDPDPDPGGQKRPAKVKKLRNCMF